MIRDGFLDIFTSRRNNFDDCIYWKQDDDEVSSILDYEYLEPSGTFSANQITAIERMPQILMGMFMFDSTTVTISSNDSLHDLDKNDIVKFRGKIYRVESIQEIPIRKTNQFSDDMPMTYYMRLKR